MISYFVVDRYNTWYHPSEIKLIKTTIIIISSCLLTIMIVFSNNKFSLNCGFWVRQIVATITERVREVGGGEGRGGSGG